MCGTSNGGMKSHICHQSICIFLFAVSSLCVDILQVGKESIHMEVGQSWTSFPYLHRTHPSHGVVITVSHFLKPEEEVKSEATPMKQSPSSVLKVSYQALNQKDPSESMLENVAKETLLPIDEVCMWLDHLKTTDTNRSGNQTAQAGDTADCNHYSRTGRGHVLLWCLSSTIL